MDRTLTNNALRFVLLLLIQIVVLNNIHIEGYMVPYVYVLYIILFPFSFGMGAFLISSFALGLTMDIFEVSGGLHAMACVLMAFVRNGAVVTFLGVPKKELSSFDPFNIHNVKVASLILFVGLIFIHHFTLYFFEYLSFSYIWDVIILSSQNTLITTSLSLIVLVFMYGYNRNKHNMR